MKIALAQLNPLIGNLEGNADLIISACKKAATLKANLLITPELSLWGYPPKDLLLNSILIKNQRDLLDHIASILSLEAPHLQVLIGVAESAPDFQLPQLFNSLAIVESSGWKIIARKQLLPSYDVFDEARYFRPGDSPSTLDLLVEGKKYKLGLTICEDLWVEEELQGQRISGPDPIEKLLPKKIDLLLNLSASPFGQKKQSLRNKLATKAAKRLKCPIIYLNQVGGNDELVFDGGSFIMNSQAEIALTMHRYQEDFAIWDTSSRVRSDYNNDPIPEEEVFNALVLGVKDYASKCHFNSALIGLSGGIDSALVAIIAAAALGPENITAVLMPSPWSSTNSVKDALELAKRIRINTHIVPIKNLMESFDLALEKPLGKLPNGVTAENLQSRIRGTLLMALANQEGHLLLSTGNKSELAVGYCTLYGDMNGGLSVIGDLYKTTVFGICNWLDKKSTGQFRGRLGLPSNGDLIGQNILIKPPSAELSPGQLDSDSLPDYSVLDPILKALIEERLSPEQLKESGHDYLLVNRIQKLLRKGEFKRKQAPPLLKVSHQAFGSGWRVPIAAK